MLRAIFEIATEEPSGFGAEQVLYGRGFFELGRRTDAVAWTTHDADAVVRISRDGEGSAAYFNLAQTMRGNPYMPVVFDHKIMPCGNHIALVEKLENPGQAHIYPRLKDIGQRLKQGAEASYEDVSWYEEMKHTALMCSSLRHFFSSENFHLDIETLPEPAAFREAAIAITELSAQMNRINPAFVPSPDINETNVLWRRTENGLFPVLYDSVSLHRADHPTEERMAVELRRRLGMDLPAP